MKVLRDCAQSAQAHANTFNSKACASPRWPAAVLAPLFSVQAVSWGELVLLENRRSPKPAGKDMKMG